MSAAPMTTTAGLESGGATSGNAVLEIEGLEVWYGDFRALGLEHVRLHGGAIGLLGPNGAGKSTLLKALLGLVRPRRGRLVALGLDTSEHSLEIRRRVGFMSEDDAFVPDVSSVELVALAGELAGLHRRDALRRAHEVLSYLDLEEVRYRSIHEYSRGMKQRLKLAQALVHDPQFLILDEPTSGLDPSGRRSMLSLIRALHREHGKSILVSTHLLGDVERVCDAVLVLRQGRVLACGKLADLRPPASSRFRLRLRGEGKDLAATRLRERSLLGTTDARPSDGEATAGQYDPAATRGDELVVEAPPGWSASDMLRLWSELAANAGGAAFPALLAVTPQRERLEDLFSRWMREDALAGPAPRRS